MTSLNCSIHGCCPSHVTYVHHRIVTMHIADIAPRGMRVVSVVPWKNSIAHAVAKVTILCLYFSNDDV